MKITWDNIDNFIIRPDGYFNRIDVSESLRFVIYILIEDCECCGDPYFMDRRKIKKGLGCFCSLPCFNTDQPRLRPDNKKWIKQNYHRYSIYQPQLEPYGVICRCKDNDILEVQCIYCGKWFVPEGNTVRSKAWAISHKGHGECNIYCSEWCKYNCPTFNKSKYPKGFRQSTSREVQPQLRKMVFVRDNYTCNKCGSNENLHCHHLTGVEQNPIESADIDNCITLCYDCHMEVHKQKGCSRYDLQKCV